MEQSDLLRYVVGRIDSLDLRYFITGSIAAVYYGEPRFTNDIDIVVALPPRLVRDFCRAFPPSEFYVSEDAARQAVETAGQFNIIHPASGLKVDILVPPDTPFNRGRFARATRVRPTEDFEASLSSPEDVILKKMEYYRDGGSEKHLRDIAGILRISGDRVDRDYIGCWVERLGLQEIWAGVRAPIDE